MDFLHASYEKSCNLAAPCFCKPIHQNNLNVNLSRDLCTFFDCFPKHFDKKHQNMLFSQNNLTKTYQNIVSQNIYNETYQNMLFSCFQPISSSHTIFYFDV